LLEPEPEPKFDTVFTEPGAWLPECELFVGVSLDTLRAGVCNREEFLVALGVYVLIGS
jgi:hypothetical protein